MDYFRDEHQLFRSAVRRFVEEEIVPNVDEWEERGEIPRSLFRQLGELGFLGVEYPPEYGGGGADFWMTVVLAEEMARCRAGGVAFSVIVHTDMSSPWLARLGTAEQKARYLPSVISGEKVCALAITEPGAGSDMAGIATRAERDGDEWVLNGSKTFTTNGVYGDLYFVSARTGREGPRHRQLSQMLVERDTPGLTVTKKLDKTGMLSSDTAEIAFEDARVPVSNLLGEENRGFHQLASGLQRERLLAAVLSISAASQALEDTKRVPAPARGIRPSALTAAGPAPQVRGCTDQARGGPPAHVPRGVPVRARRGGRGRGVDGQAPCNRGGQHGRLRGRADARGLRLHQGDAGRKVREGLPAMDNRRRLVRDHAGDHIKAHARANVVRVKPDPAPPQ